MTEWLFKSTDRLPQCASVVLGMPRNLRTINNFRGISEEDRGKGGERRGCRTVVNCSNSYQIVFSNTDRRKRKTLTALQALSN